MVCLSLHALPFTKNAFFDCSADNLKSFEVGSNKWSYVESAWQFISHIRHTRTS